ncbi:MAG TPA: polysaccharide deacetylase family protein, partial [Armatimonadota bacterium]
MRFFREKPINDPHQNQHTEQQVRWGLPLAGWLITSLLVALLYVAIIHPDLRLWRGVDTHGNTHRRAVALTFDDGPDPLWAPLIADTLERHGARGTFFLVGVDAQRYPEIAARLARGGHQVGNHSMTHPYPNLTAFPPKQISWEILNAAKLLQQFTRQQIVDFRPPGGGVNDALLRTAKAHGMRVAWWSQNAGDWSSPTPELITSRLQRTLRPGSVMLLHEREHTVAALENYLAGGVNTGYTYITFTEM